MLGKGLQLKNYLPVSLRSVVSKVFEKVVNDKIAYHLEKCGFFSDFQYGFRSSRSFAELLTVASDKIARALIRFGATRAVTLDISRAFGRAWHAVLHHKLKSYRISCQMFGLIHDIQRRKSPHVTYKDLVSWLARNQEFNLRNYVF